MASLTLRDATSPQTYPIRRMLKDHGHDAAVEVLAQVLTQADVACGGDPKPEMMEIWASSLLNRFNHFSLETFVLAIRDGLNSGKVYGKLNLPQVSEWMAAVDQRICSLAENEAMQNKFSGDNLGADYMDRLQYAAGSDQRRLQRANAVIRELERKLSNDPPAAA